MRRSWAVVIVALGALACGPHSDGSECSSADECQEGRLCTASADGLTRCMRPCEADVFLCDDGSVCLDAPAGRLCWFGGRTPYRDPCSDSFECEAGTVCTGTCEQACDVADDRICRATELCTPTAGSATQGTCVTVAIDAGPPDAGE